MTRATGVIGDDAEDFEYDGLGRFLEAQDGDSTVRMTYDSLSRVLTEKQGSNPLGSEAKTVTSTWGYEEERTGIEYPSGFEVARTYDAIHRLTELEDGSSNPIATIDLYGAGGRRKQVSYGNGATSSWTWDGFRRPTDISHEDSGSSEFAGFEYAWDKNDNPLYEARRHKSGKGDVYSYDHANRLSRVLTDVDDPAAEVASPGTEAYDDKVEFNMDDVFNFTSVATSPYGGSAASVSYTTNAMNEYTAVGGTTHVYDSNGNLTDDGVNTYEYDFHNHLAKVMDKNSSTTIATYAYDILGRGRRTAKTVGSDTTRFVYDDQHVVAEYDVGTGDLLRKFVYRGGWDQIVMMVAPDVADVDNDQYTTETKHFYFHTQIIGQWHQAPARAESDARAAGVRSLPAAVRNDPETIHGSRIAHVARIAGTRVARCAADAFPVMHPRHRVRRDGAGGRYNRGVFEVPRNRRPLGPPNPWRLIQEMSEIHSSSTADGRKATLVPVAVRHH